MLESVIKVLESQAKAELDELGARKVKRYVNRLQMYNLRWNFNVSQR